jgi:alkanesulfonate monooxygenase SsuD/methylene tetrahydromethanopterin reductase-like flavin-dependent oxidoreductase (luciferase family)
VSRLPGRLRDHELVRIGISPYGSTREGVLRVAKLAVEGGLDTLWLGDGYVAGPEFPGWAGSMESMTELAWLAGAFPEARIGITAAVLPVRDPRGLAREVHTMDHLTAGNFVLVVAAGYWDRDLIHRGVDPADRGRRFDEHLGALRAVLAGQGYDGEHIKVPAEGRLSPLPFRPDGPPLWLAGGRPTMNKALELGLAYQSTRATPDELEPVARVWFDRGGATLAHRAYIQVADTSNFEYESSRNAMSGPVDFVVDVLGRFAAMGVADISIVPGRDDVGALRNVESIIETVLPQL